MLKARQVQIYVVLCDGCEKPVTAEVRRKDQALVALGKALGQGRAFLVVPEGETDISAGEVRCPECHQQQPANDDG